MACYNNSNSHSSPYVEIVEQPLSKIRFRYQSEGRASSAIPGANSKDDNKTFTKIRIVGYTGKASVVVSCVTDTKPYKPHPHKLVPRGELSNLSGEYTTKVSEKDMSVTFYKMGIQCVKRDEISTALSERQKKNIDPFKTGYSHDTKEINLNAVRLCFQAFIYPGDKMKPIPLKPVVSDPITRNNELTIVDISDVSSSVSGGKKIMLFCDKVKRNDIAVQLFEPDSNGVILWKAVVNWNNKTMNVHRQTGISFKTPKYKCQDIDEPVKAFLQLYRPSDEATSALIPFEYTPLESHIQMRRKRKKGLTEESKQMYALLDSNEKEIGQEIELNIPLIDDIKVEEKCRSTPGHNMNNLINSENHPIQRQPLHSINRNHTYQLNQRQEMQSEPYRNQFGGDQMTYQQPQYNMNIPSVFCAPQNNYTQHYGNTYVNSPPLSFNQFQPMDTQGAVGGCPLENNENLSSQFNVNVSHPYLNTGSAYMQYYQSNAQQNRTFQYQQQMPQQNINIATDAEKTESRQMNTGELCEALIDITDSVSNSEQNMKITPIHPDLINITYNFNDLDTLN